MLEKKQIQEGKQCTHSNCREVCHRIYKEKKQSPIKRTPLKNSRKPIPKVSAKKKVEKVAKTGSNELWRWFLERRSEMSGTCAHCGGKSSRDNDDYFHFSIAHILPKSLFPSVATHPLNWIELCYFSPSCHANFDNFTLDITDLNCFDTVIEKFLEIYPSIAEKEKRRIPQALLQYLNTDI